MIYKDKASYGSSPPRSSELTFENAYLVGENSQNYISFVKEPYKRDDILQKRPQILRSLLIVATL